MLKEKLRQAIRLSRKPVRNNADQKAILAGIRANPLDDAPKLIHTDWLEERGSKFAGPIRDAIHAGRITHHDYSKPYESLSDTHDLARLISRNASWPYPSAAYHPSDREDIISQSIGDLGGYSLEDMDAHPERNIVRNAWRMAEAAKFDPSNIRRPSTYLGERDGLHFHWEPPQHSGAHGVLIAHVIADAGDHQYRLPTAPGTIEANVRKEHGFWPYDTEEPARMARYPEADADHAAILAHAGMPTLASAMQGMPVRSTPTHGAAYHLHNLAIPATVRLKPVGQNWHLRVGDGGHREISPMQAMMIRREIEPHITGVGHDGIADETMRMFAKHDHDNAEGLLGIRKDEPAPYHPDAWQDDLKTRQIRNSRETGFLCDPITVDISGVVP